MINKKIAIIINTLKIGGGAERVAAYVGEELRGQNIETAFLLFDDSGDKYSSVDTFLIGGNKAPKNSWESWLAIFRRGKEIARFCRENKISTCLGFMEEANFAAVASKLFFGNKAKIICSLRNNPEKKKSNARLLIRFFYAFSDVVVANSEALRSIAEKNFGLKRTAVVFNPVAYARIADLKEKDLPAKWSPVFAGNKTFLNIGRLTAQKDQATLIKSFKIVLAKEPAAKLAIIGEGELRADLEKLAADLGLGDKVFFLGRQENVFPFLKASAVFVLSSLWEGMPNSVLEALAVGLPVAAADCPTGPREIIAPAGEGSALPLATDRGILVQPGNSEMLSAAMLKLLGQDKKEIIDNRFQSDNVLAEWKKIL